MDKNRTHKLENGQIIGVEGKMIKEENGYPLVEASHVRTVVDVGGEFSQDSRIDQHRNIGGIKLFARLCWARLWSTMTFFFGLWHIKSKTKLITTRQIYFDYGKDIIKECLNCDDMKKVDWILDFIYGSRENPVRDNDDPNIDRAFYQVMVYYSRQLEEIMKNAEREYENEEIKLILEKFQHMYNAT